MDQNEMLEHLRDLVIRSKAAGDGSYGDELAEAFAKFDEAQTKRLLPLPAAWQRH